MVTAPHAPVPFSPPLEDLYIPSAARSRRRCAGPWRAEPEPIRQGRKRPMSDAIKPIVMPKWGLAMEEGMVAKLAGRRGRGDRRGPGDPRHRDDSKIANVFESPVAGRCGGGGRRGRDRAGRRAARRGRRRSRAGCRARRLRRQVPGGVRGLPQRPARPRPSRETIEAGGRRLRYLGSGGARGTPVLFIHGFGGDLSAGCSTRRRWPRTAPTYALDLPGHGGSTKDLGSGQADVGALAAAVIDFMDAKASPRRIWSAIRSAARSRSIWRSTTPSGSRRRP